MKRILKGILCYLFIYSVYSSDIDDFRALFKPEDPINVKAQKLGIELVKIPAGSFMMGSTKEEVFELTEFDPNFYYDGTVLDELPRHRVTISKDFYIGKYEFTQGLWEKFMKSNPSLYKGDKLPVETITFQDIRALIIKLNIIVNCKTPDTILAIDESGVNAAGHGCFRLPTEAEWEYAARAGTKTAFHYGNESNYRYSNHNGFYPMSTRPANWIELTHKYHKFEPFEVGQYNPNQFGLYDIHGNVMEFAQDIFDEHYYEISPSTDPVCQHNPKHLSGLGNRRVVRSGSFLDLVANPRSAKRYWRSEFFTAEQVGFRIAATKDKPKNMD